MKVLVLDSSQASRVILERLVLTLDATTWVEVTGDPKLALAWVQDTVPDLVLVDSDAGPAGAPDFLRQFRSIPSCAEVPVVVLAEPQERVKLREALEAGANDYIPRPPDREEFRTRCRNLLELRRQRALLEHRAEWLARRVREATEAIREREHDTLLRLAKAGEFRDQDTGGHVVRMAQYCRVIAETLGVDEEECAILESAAPLHDIGKIGVPDEILRLPRRLTPEEFEGIKRHTTMGFEILRGSPSKFLQAGATIALCHHERWDGSGYPGGLSGFDIPLRARIVAVADVYDALSTKRPYKQAWPHGDAMREVIHLSGQHLDPECVQAFRFAESRILGIRENCASTAQEAAGTDENLNDRQLSLL
jgi:two-component system response regulator RpfG